MKKTHNQKAWFMVLPVLLLVSFSAIIPLMTVVNYSVQDTFGNNEFFWVGLEWFEEILHSERMHDALSRQALFTSIILLIEIPLGIILMPFPKQSRYCPKSWVSNFHLNLIYSHPPCRYMKIYMSIQIRQFRIELHLRYCCLSYLLFRKIPLLMLIE